MSRRVVTFSDAHLDTTSLGKRNPRLISFSNDKHIPLPRSKSVILCILDMNDIISSMMSFTMCYNPNSANVVSRSNHGNVSNVKFNVTGDLGSFQVETNGVADFDCWVGVADGAGVVGYEVGDSCLAELDAFDFAEFVFGFFGSDAMDSEAAFDIVDKTEVFTGLVDGDNI